MAVDVFINFKGNCREAVEFYAKVFDCEKPKIMTYSEIPQDQNYPPISEEQKNLILYTSLNIAGSNVMFSDIPAEVPFTQGTNINVTIGSKDAEKIKQWFERLKEDASVHMELQKTFWSDCYGMLTDKFGIPWQFSLDSGNEY